MMEKTFNINELFEIAVQIERNGGAFYRKAAEDIVDDRSREQLLDLAAMEDSHVKIFSAMQQEVAQQHSDLVADDPNQEARKYLRVFASGQVFDLTRDPMDFLQYPRTIEEILRKAIELERDTVLYYLGMKSAVPPTLGGEKVDKIIQEEMGHITLLSGWLDKLT